MTETSDSSPDSDALVSQRYYDPEADDDLTTTIIEAVAEAKDVEATAVTDPLLYDSIDAAALEDSLFNQSAAVDPADSGSVRFEYHGFTITVESEGWVTVYDDRSGPQSE
jgi:hypothetical protein